LSGPPRTLRVVLIKPSRYDAEGYVVRHVFGTLPSNTLAVLHALVHDAVVERRALGPRVQLDVEVYDENVHRVPVARIVRRARRRDEKTLVLLCGVHTAHFPRAADLARDFRAAGIAVALGGFHVSGSLAMLPEIAPEIRALMDQGVAVVAGELEERADALLLAAFEGKLEPLYDFLSDRPDLGRAPPPRIDRNYLRRFPGYTMVTLDASRGCPFTCSFCAIINVQGRSMRARTAETIARTIEHHYRAHGLDHHFFTDDNFSRNPEREAILDALIELREERGVPVLFDMQVDTAAYRIRGFVERAARAGCQQVFIGMESIDAVNLAAASKRQNTPARYGEMIERWRGQGIVTQVGYIIGFPNDTKDSVARDVEAIETEVRPDLVNFFMLTPLPGTEDHRELVRRGVALDPDLNRYDTCHAVAPHPRMSAEEWSEAFRGAWLRFYRLENVRAILARAHPRARRHLFKALCWYRQAALVQQAHPLVSGYWRKRDRRSRRPGVTPEGPFTARWRGAARTARSARSWWRFGREMHALWREILALPPESGVR
jgi:radical SAM superfamily enzyme YgiQ (UPF0313 family)